MKALVIEDSVPLQRSLQAGLSRSGFAVDVVGDGEEGLSHALLGRYDVVVLDLMLPGRDGMDVLRRLRAAGNDTHVLVLSARDQVAQRVAGLQLGADDYLTKPFDFDELVARLRALVRRRHGDKNPRPQLGELQLDTARRTVAHKDRTVPLTRQEFAILEYLVARRGRVVSKGDLLDHVYAGDDQVSENAIEVFVHQLRKKIRDVGHADVIRTQRGHGYLVE